MPLNIFTSLLFAGCFLFIVTPAFSQNDTLSEIKTDTVFLEKAENIYNEENSMNFGKYLYYKGDYPQSIIEFERVLFMNDEKGEAANFLIRALRKTGKYENAINEIYKRHGLPETLSADMLKELIALNIYLGNFESAESYLVTTDKFNADERLELNLQIAFMQDDYDKAISLYTEKGFDNRAADLRFRPLINAAESYNHKRPGVALGLSTVVPGLGKVYAGAWKDGIISFLFVGGAAFQAYRGFSRRGVESAHGWVFGAIGLGFYSGNLYGSWRAAEKSNEIQKHQIRHHVQSFDWLTD
ncbi:MAG: hypothetical protein EA412_12190 [Chitinophagaceae bacterium]|nr:MAG: hypothetical protein EA412_12190 [Chitinophagaceae bacterium]